jgi:hypothetical protein
MPLFTPYDMNRLAVVVTDDRVPVSSSVLHLHAEPIQEVPEKRDTSRGCRDTNRKVGYQSCQADMIARASHVSGGVIADAFGGWFDENKRHIFHIR